MLALLLALLLAAPAADARFPPHGEGGGSVGGGGHSVAVSCPGSGTTSSTIVCSGTYVGTAPTTGGWTYAWNATCSGSGTPTVSGISGGTITTITVTTPSSACAGTLTLVDNLPDTAPPTGTVTISAPSNSITLSCPGTGATSSSIACTGTYTGTAPSTSGWSYTWNSTCSGSGTPTVSGIGGGVITNVSVTTPGSACTGTLSVTDNLSNSATSSSVAISVPGPLSLLRVEDGSAFSSAAYPGGYTIGGVGKFSGTAPSSMTAAMTGCGGGAPATSALFVNPFGSGTYQIQFAMPTTAGTGCTITVTDNLSRTATSPPFNIIGTSPLSTVTANIHNAPGWIASHTYSTGARVLNGAGWTPGSPGHFNPGSPLYAYELTSGSCTSGSTGPLVTSGSTTEGSCTWAVKSVVDYVTITGFNFDAPLWVSGKTYTFLEGMTVNDGGTLRAYQLDGGNQSAFCTSTVAPTGAGSAGSTWGLGQQTTGDSCIWDYMGDVSYSSGLPARQNASYMNGGGTAITANMHGDRPYTVLIWNDAEYVAGSGGERNPISFYGHYANGLAIEGNVQGPFYYTSVSAAAGEGFASHMTTSTPLAGYDASKGVAIRNPNSTADSLGPVFNNGGGPAGLFLYDLGMDIRGLQVKAAAGQGIAGFNQDVIVNNIIDGGYNNAVSWCNTMWLDNIAVVANNLILSHGCSAIGAKYGNIFIVGNTFVNVGPQANTSLIIYGWSWVFQDIVLANNAISGFAHVGAQNTSTAGIFGTAFISSRSVGNVTDVASPDNTGTSWYIDGTAGASTVRAVPGVTFGVSAASMFVSPGSDYRPNTGLTSAGTAFGGYDIGCRPDLTPPCIGGPLDFATPDFLGNARPNGSSQYSTGAEQHP